MSRFGHLSASDKDPDQAEPDKTARENTRDAAADLCVDWITHTRDGHRLWSLWCSGQTLAEVKTAMDEASDRAFEIEDRLAATPASTLAGVAGKLRIYAHYCAEQGGEPAPEDRLALSALADLERMIGQGR